MNEELQKALGELLSKASNGIDSASGFLMAELPDVIYQLLMWHGVYNFILFIVCLLVPLLIASNLNKLKLTVPPMIKEGEPDNFYWRDGNRKYSSFSFNCERTEISIIADIAKWMIVFVSILACMANINLQWLQIWIAPKVWLLEYAAKLSTG
jgi:hypothetical protein